MTFSDYATAARARDVFTRIAENVVNRMRPDTMVGEVYDINVDAGTALIRLPGHKDDELLEASFGANMVPGSSVLVPHGDTDIVRVAGTPGSYYIITFLRGSPRYIKYEYALVPVAVPVPWMSSSVTAPDGFLLMQDQFVSQLTYPVLFSHIGHSGNNGVDPGDGTFRIPSMAGYSPIGIDGSTFQLGKTYGALTKTLTAADLPEHDHSSGSYATSSDGSHDHQLDLSSTAGSSNSVLLRGTSTVVATSPAAIANDGVHGHNVTGRSGMAYSGAAAPVSLLHPVRGVQWIIKY